MKHQAVQSGLSKRGIQYFRLLDLVLAYRALDEVARAFGNLVEPLFRRVSQSGHESRTLAALSDELLPKLIRGEIRVKDAERLISAMRETDSKEG